jgi:dihydrofolate reductase
MGKVIVVAFITLDGIVEDPDGSWGLRDGGWAFHAGSEIFAGDKFDTGSLLEAGAALLLGRRTWELFADRWPRRSGGFADVMNAATKLVVSHDPPALDAWPGSTALTGDLVDAVVAASANRDVIVVGSTNVVHQLAAADAVDEYRLATIPIAVGAGTPLFTEPTALALRNVESKATYTLAAYDRDRAG